MRSRHAAEAAANNDNVRGFRHCGGTCDGDGLLLFVIGVAKADVEVRVSDLMRLPVRQEGGYYMHCSTECVSYEDDYETAAWLPRFRKINEVKSVRERDRAQATGTDGRFPATESPHAFVKNPTVLTLSFNCNRYLLIVISLADDCCSDTGIGLFSYHGDGVSTPSLWSVTKDFSALSAAIGPTVAPACFRRSAQVPDPVLLR